MVICLEQGAGLNTTQLMPLPLTISCSSKIHIGFTFVVPTDLGSSGQRAVKQVYVCVQFERFLPPDAAVVASVYAPIMFPPAGVLMFKNTKDGEWYLTIVVTNSDSFHLLNHH